VLDLLPFTMASHVTDSLGLMEYMSGLTTGD
jgi:hypothetical protein